MKKELVKGIQAEQGRGKYESYPMPICMCVSVCEVPTKLNKGEMMPRIQVNLLTVIYMSMQSLSFVFSTQFMNVR